MTTVAELEVKIGADTSDVEKGLNNTSNKIDDLGKTARAAGDVLKKAMAGAGGAVLAIGTGAAKAAMDFETAFAEVRKTVDATDEQFAALETQIRDMATDSDNPLSALDNAHETLTGIAAMAGSLGIATDEIDEFVTVVGAMTVATDMSAESAANFAARFANVTGMAMSDMPNLGNTIVELGNSMAATESEIASFANRLSGLATFGFKPEEILGYSAALASLGISTELGSTNLSKTISDINAAVADGGADLKLFAETAGMTADEFKKLNESDPSAAFDAFIEGLGKMDATEQLQTLKELNITSSEQQNVLLKMAEGYDTVKSAQDKAANAWGNSNALMDEATKKADTTAAGFARVNNKMNDIGITIGSRMLPGIEKVTDSLGSLFDQLGEGDIGGALGEIPGIIDGIGEAVAGAFGLGDGWNAFVAGLESGANSLQIILDRIIRGLDVWGMEARMKLLDFISGFRDIILSATGGEVDIAPKLTIEQGEWLTQLNNMKFADAMTAAIYADLADGSVDLSNAKITIDGIDSMLGDNLEMLNLSPTLLQKVADGMGFEAKRAFEAAINTAFTSGDMETVQLMLPLAITAGMDIEAIKTQIQEDLAAISTGDTEGIDIPVTLDMANALGMDTTATTEAIRQQVTDSLGDAGLDLGSIPISTSPTLSDTEGFYFDTHQQMVSAMVGRIFPITTDVDATPVVDASFVPEVETWIASNTYDATISVNVTATPGSINVTGVTSAVVSAIAAGAPGNAGGGDVINPGGAGPYHTGGTYTPPGGGMEGPAWLKRGETVRTTAQESAIQKQLSGSGSGGNTFVIYGDSPYEVAAMVDRANRDRGR